MVRFVDSESLTEGEPGAEGVGLAPVIPLFGGSGGAGQGGSDSDDQLPDAGAGRGVREGRGARASRASRSRVEPEPLSPEAAEEAAEQALLKRLRTRSLSVRESHDVLRGHEVSAEASERIIARMLDYGYLDDAALAEQLVHAGADRKGQGRRAIGQTLAKRGVPREVADAALEQMPDDDAERALEFARTKARSLASLDHDAALRRLSGQLARRGYGGSVALDAARRALDEVSKPSSGVRFR